MCFIGFQIASIVDNFLINPVQIINIPSDTTFKKVVIFVQQFITKLFSTYQYVKFIYQFLPYLIYRFMKYNWTKYVYYLIVFSVTVLIFIGKIDMTATIVS